MNVTIQELVTAMIKTPAFAVTVVLILGVILVNGWTDAPNAIATTVATGTLGIRSAIFFAAAMNFLGLWLTTRGNSAVAASLYHLAEFEDGSGRGIVALCAAFAAILLWSVFAWWWGIPTSESHALIAGLSGASVALGSSVSGINRLEWIRVFAGLFGSIAIGCIAGAAFCLLFRKLETKKQVNPRRQRHLQILACGVMAFLHGAQDGQKFLGVLLLGIHLHSRMFYESGHPIPGWMVLLCAGTMALGTALGGRRIIQKVGNELVPLEPPQALAADAAGILSITLATMLGIPVSTTHAKTAAILGAGATVSRSSVNWKLASEMMLTWIVTFPGCGILGFVVTKLFLHR